ncbi:KELCH REPEAT F-BOX PROTEIN [Salix purpurea]|uniref:KELCH REPEAT F-BOX PROTEIN n=1 Tax=Salix purpurea TaxID=77065 RepID=A0A9Q0VTD8_SALPP|nr:KELCH REPEAT F-BOX PROTEIN [Salix purpurea]
MSKGKELGSEDGRGDVSRNDPDPSKKRVLAEDPGNSFWITSISPPMKKMGVCEISRRGSGCYDFSCSNDRVGDSSNVRPQDVDYSYAPQLSDELENLILARIPRSEYWKFPIVNKRILSLVKSGREIDGVVVWRYELETNSWNKGPSMINPRCLFASASCEKYNPDTKSWEDLPRMRQKRRLCSGCFLDNKFYVIGGRNEEGKVLTCAEAYDEDKKAWDLIPDMLEDTPIATFQSPPLIAVVNNELYSLEPSSNQLKVYLKKSRTWKKLGPVPVRADSNKGWGVAFKSLGNELLVIGASTCTVSYSGDGMAIYTCRPDSESEELLWRPLECGKNRLSNFILNCSVMVA